MTPGSRIGTRTSQRSTRTTPTPTRPQVSTELTAEGEQIAASFGRVPEDQWGRKGTRSNGSEFTVLTFAQYFLHDVVHHLHDVDG